MAEVKRAAPEAAAEAVARALPRRRELGAALAVALVLALWPVWRGLLDPSRVLFAVDTATVQLPWSALGTAEAAAARNPELSDQGVVFYPAYRWVIDRMGRGELPLWNPHVHAGAPGLGNPQLGVLDPQVWLLVVLDRLGGRALADWGLALLAWLRLAAAGLGAYLLARALGLGARGAALAGISFAGSGFLVLWLNHSLGHVAPALPWVLLLIERARYRSAAAAIVPIALVLALAILGGHPETACFVGLTGGLWALGLWREQRGAALASLAGLALGTALAAVSWLPFLEYVRSSGAAVARSLREPAALQLWPLGALVLAAGALLRWREQAGAAERSAPGDARARASARGAAALATAALFAAAVVARFPWHVLLHDSLGTPVDGTGYRGSDGYVERYAAWLALPAVALALAGLFTVPQARARGRFGFVALLGGVAWLVALGLPSVEALFVRLPGLGLAAGGRAAVVSALMLSLLAGMGLERAGWVPRAAGAALVLAGCLLAAFGPVAAVPGPDLPGDPPDELAALTTERELEAGSERGQVGRSRARGRVSAALEAGGAQLVCERWIGGDQFRLGGPGVLASAAGEPGRPRELTVRAELDERRLASGTWRVALRVFDAAGVQIGARASDAFTVRHVPVLSGPSALVLAATVLLMLLGSGGIRALLILTLVHAGSFAHGMNPAVPRAACFPETATTRVLSRRLDGRRFLADRGVLPPNTGMVYGLSSLGGYDGLDVASFNDLRYAALRPGAHPLLDWTPRGVDLDAPAFRLFGVGALVCAGPLEHPDWTLVAGPDGAARPGVEWAETWIYVPRAPLPRAFLVPRAIGLDEVLADPQGFDPRSEAYLPEGSWAPATPFERAEVRAQSFGHERIELEVELDGEGLLVVTEQHFPGWVARVDGAPRELLRVDSAFRGVPLRPGDRRVELVYRPASLRWGAGLSLAALVALLVLVLSSLLRRAPAAGARSATMLPR